MAPFLTPRQVAERWQRTPEHVQRLCARGELRALKDGKRGWRISAEALASYEAGHSSEATPEPAPSPVVVASQTATVPTLGPLPDGYKPRFPEAWGMSAPTKKATPVRS